MPIPHLKLAVICASWRWDGEYGGELDRLDPVVAWWGSANWTDGASRHLELGAWTTDAAFCQASLDFLVDLIRFSEQPLSDRAGPEPDLVDAEWDDEAFAEWAAEESWDWRDPDDEDDAM